MVVKPHIKPEIAVKKTGRTKKNKGATQERTPMQRILVLRNGRRKVLEWRTWGT